MNRVTRTAVGEVELLAGERRDRGSHPEVTAALVVQERSEDAGRVEARAQNQSIEPSVATSAEV